MTVPSGSIVTVGVGGPSFEIVLPGVTIEHLEGPLAGQHQYFPATIETIVFGRPPQKTDLGEAHLRRILRAYARYYNDIRTHRSLDKDAPISRPVQRTGIIRSHAILGGLHHHYVRV